MNRRPGATSIRKNRPPPRAPGSARPAGCARARDDVTRRPRCALWMLLFTGWFFLAVGIAHPPPGVTPPVLSRLGFNDSNWFLPARFPAPSRDSCARCSGPCHARFPVRRILSLFLPSQCPISSPFGPARLTDLRTFAGDGWRRAEGDFEQRYAR